FRSRSWASASGEDVDPVWLVMWDSLRNAHELRLGVRFGPSLGPGRDTSPCASVSATQQWFRRRHLAVLSHPAWAKTATMQPMGGREPIDDRSDRSAPWTASSSLVPSRTPSQDRRTGDWD